jgi:hypothetical protein
MEDFIEVRSESAGLWFTRHGHVIFWVIWQKRRRLMKEKIKIGDRFIKPDSKKVYVVTKAVMNGDWVILKEEDGELQILTSKESLEAWIREKN